MVFSTQVSPKKLGVCQLQDGLNEGTGHQQQLHTFVVPLYNPMQQFISNDKIRVCDQSTPLDGLPVHYGHLLERTKQVVILQLGHPHLA